MLRLYGILLALLCLLPLRAQEVESYRFDIGAGVGMSGYLGDADESNMYRHPGLAANASFRYLASSRFALRTIVNVATLSGNTAHWKDVLPGGAQYSFKSTAIDLGVRAEFNFLPYGQGQTYLRLKRWSPYLALGVGVTLALTEGGKNAICPSLPMAFGVKYKVRERLNLSAEFAMIKTFGDKVDADTLTDLYAIKSSFFKNNDWVSALTLGISWEFGPRCVQCNRKD